MPGPRGPWCSSSSTRWPPSRNRAPRSPRIRMSRPLRADNGAVDVTPGLLRSWPLPRPGEGGKTARGDVLVVGGTAETPGAVVLAGLAALRAGAGRLKILTVDAVASHVAAAVPEARVIGTRATEAGAINPAALDQRLKGYVSAMSAVLVGPGALDPDETRPLLEAVVAAVDGGTVVIDANAAVALGQRPGLLEGLHGSAVLVPNPAEAASMLSVDEDAVAGAPGDAAAELASRFGAAASVRAPETWTTAPDSPRYRDGSGNPGLGTSGSGDVASGLVTGLAARGADPLQAAVWGVHLHAAAGEHLAVRLGPVGYLARELLDDVPSLLAELTV